MWLLVSRGHAAARQDNSHPGLRQPVGGTVIGRAELTTVRSDLADAWAPYLTMGEAIKVTAQSFTMDVEMLSCCAA